MLTKQILVAQLAIESTYDRKINRRLNFQLYINFTKTQSLHNDKPGLLCYNNIRKAKGEHKMTREEMIKAYKEMAAAHKYLVGFEYENRLWYVMEAGMIRDDMLKGDRAAQSKGGMLKVRVRLNAKLKAMLVHTGKAILLGAADLLNTNDKYNRGERFERLVTEQLTGETWVKDSIPFNVAGDIRLNGEEVQVKFDGAELTNEKTLARAMA